MESSQSAALFVGIRDFPYDGTLTEVRYAVDDAVDLAYAVAIERQPRLVDPKRVVLALSGEPQKPESIERLERLVEAGAQKSAAGQSDLLTLLEEQSRAVGTNGLLVIAFATHGISYEGTQYLLPSTAMLHHVQTMISEAKVRDIVAQARVPRSLILLDACRRALTSDTRAGEADPRSAAALLRELASVTGQIVFSAAAAGEYAYDDDVRRNGVFTATLLDGLRCEAASDPRGFITVETLAAYVEEQVLSWIQKHRDPQARRATQLHSEGRSRAMPLAVCTAARQ